MSRSFLYLFPLRDAPGRKAPAVCFNTLAKRRSGATHLERLHTRVRTQSAAHSSSATSRCQAARRPTCFLHAG